MRKNVLVIAAAALVTAINIGALAYTHHHATQGVVFENENVVVKYYDVKDGEYDILVETKNNTNITSEWEMKEATNYNFTYLIGRSEETAKTYYEDNLKDLGYKWTWEDNYQIEYND